MPVNESVTAALSLIEKDASKTLGVTVGTHTVVPGQYIPRAEAQSPPELAFTVPSASGTYMAICLDIDAPFPSFGVLGPILHWVQPGLKPEPTTNGQSILKVTAPFVANYIGPAPPPGSAPHRYVFFLYQQPEGFDGKKYAPPNGQNLSNWYRMRYDLDAWRNKTKLGPLLAANYFRSN
ncbi:phosphatidylethanolamine-binding protein [Lipomyces kononenkoae]